MSLVADRPDITIPDEAFQAAVNVSGTMRKLEAAAPIIVAANAPMLEIEALEKTLAASRDHAHRARREGLDEATCRFWSGVSGFLRSRIRALKAGEEPDWPDAANSARSDDDFSGRAAELRGGAQ